MNRPRVMVIDDDPLFRNLIVTMLRRDFVVTVASDGAEGFYKALEHPPDVAIVDVQMAGWDGLRTLKAFRGHPTLYETKVVMLTADASKETVLAAIQAGANDYVIKTHLTRESLLLKLERILPGLVIGRGTSPAPAAPVSLAAPVSVVPEAPPAEAPTKAALQELIDQWE